MVIKISSRTVRLDPFQSNLPLTPQNQTAVEQAQFGTQSPEGIAWAHLCALRADTWEQDHQDLSGPAAS